MSYKSRWSALVCLAFGISVSYANQQVPIGVKVYVQPWSPLAPANDVPTTAFGSQDGISTGMNVAWEDARKFLGDGSKRGSLRWHLEQPNLIASGITLRFLKFNINPLGPIDLQPNGPGGFRIHWQIPDTYLDLKSTTPDAAGVGLPSGGDPEFTFRFNLDLTFGLRVSDAPGGELLTVTDIHIVPSNPNFQGVGPIGDAIKATADAVSTFLKGESFNSLLNQVLNKDLAAPQNNGGYDLVKVVNDKLKPLNTQIANSGALKYVRVGLWARQSPSAQALGLLFGVKELPVPNGSSAISGTLQFMTGVGQAARPAPTTCDGLFQKGQVDVEVQRGPRPVLSADPLTDSFQYGVAPTNTIPNAVFTGGAVTNGQCSYRLTGISVWPNQVSFPPPTVKGNGNDAAAAVFWDVRPKSGESPLVTCALGGHDSVTNSYERLATDANQVVKKSAFANALNGAASGAGCAGNYDLVARTAMAMDTGKLAGRVKSVRPGDAVQNPSMYENPASMGAARLNSSRINSAHTTQSVGWGQAASSGMQQAPAQSDQKPDWNQAAVAPH